MTQKTGRVKKVWLKYQEEKGGPLDAVINNAYFGDWEHRDYVEWLEDELEKQLNL